MLDKRRCHRLSIELPATFTIQEETDVAIATTIDVSAKGIRMLTKEEVRRGQKLVIHVKLPEDGDITMHAEIVWVKRSDEAEYQAGIKIDDSMPADEQKFVRFYAKQLKEFFSKESQS